MDFVYNGKPHFLMDDLGGKPTIFGNIQMLGSGGASAAGAQRSRGLGIARVRGRRGGRDAPEAPPLGHRRGRRGAVGATAT